MNKKTIKDHLAKRFLSEEVVPGISVTKNALNQSKKINKQGVKDIEKNVADFEKAIRPDANEKEMAPNKFNYENDFEKTYHDQVEIMNGQEMIQYSSNPSERFKERALEALEGSSKMGNNPEWANVIPTQQGFTGPNFGKNLVKDIKASTKKRQDASKGLYSFGDDIENEVRGGLVNTRFSAIAENKVMASDVNEMASQKAPISEKNRMVLNKWTNELGANGAAEKLINRLSSTGMVSDFPDSIEYGTGLNKVASLLDKKDFDKAFYTAKSLATKLEKKAMKDMGMFENKDNNKPQIKETMKRLTFKNPFNGVGNALKLIPEGYRVNNKVFEMTDGNESYKIRWEGSLNEGKAVVLTAADKTLVNEDISRMKQLFGYKSHETLGLLKGKERLDENKVFSDIWNKTKTLLETEDMEGADAKEGNWDEETKKAPEATKHVKSSVKKDSAIAKGKEGNPDKAVSHAPEAKSPMKSSKGLNIETDADAAEGYWEDAAKPQAPEAKKHVHLKESEMEEVEMEETYMDEAEMEEGSLVDEGYMDEAMLDEMMKSEGWMNEAEEEGEEEEEDSWEKGEEEEDSEDMEPTAADIKSDIPVASDDEEDDLVIPSAANFKLLFSPSSGEYWIDNNGIKTQVPTKYYSIASDKNKKGADKAAKIAALMAKDSENAAEMGGEEDDEM
jgi:hypothetical protein